MTSKRPRGRPRALPGESRRDALIDSPQWAAVVATLANARKDAHLTQAELAAELHTTQRAVSLWELGKTLPRLDRFGDICRALGLLSSDVLKWAGL